MDASATRTPAGRKRTHCSSPTKRSPARRHPISSNGCASSSTRSSASSCMSRGSRFTRRSTSTCRARPSGRALHVEVERRVNLEPLLIQLLAELRVELLAHPFDEIGCRLAGDRFVGELQWVRFRPAGVRVADASILAHQLDDGIAALDRALGEANGIVAGGRLRKRRESRGFSEVQIADGLPKVSLRCSLYAVRAVTEVDLIEVELENSLLVVLRLDLACDFRFLD